MALGEVVVFGNSLSDIGNLGPAAPKHPYYKGHFSNGPVYPEYLSYFQSSVLIDNAFGGAITNGTAKSPLPLSVNANSSSFLVPNLTDQISGHLAAFASLRLVNATAIIEIGSNNVFDLNSASDVGAMGSAIVSGIADAIRRLQTAGYSRIL
ncbi:Phosphatidylcholine-sterol acyltransferase, partial [Smittium mucronatum]